MAWGIRDCLNVSPGDAIGVVSDVIHGACSHHLPAISSAVGTHVDDIVARPNHIGVMLDDNHGVALIHQSVQHAEQHANVLEVQTRGRLVQYV